MSKSRREKVEALASGSPFPGERAAAKEALKRMEGKGQAKRGSGGG
jgi:hypothetical protein